MAVRGSDRRLGHNYQRPDHVWTGWKDAWAGSTHVWASCPENVDAYPLAHLRLCPPVLVKDITDPPRPTAISRPPRTLPRYTARGHDGPSRAPSRIAYSRRTAGPHRRRCSN